MILLTLCNGLTIVITFLLSSFHTATYFRLIRGYLFKKFNVFLIHYRYCYCGKIGLLPNLKQI